jgi:hypothetical protein
VLAVHTRLCSMFPLAHSKLVFGLLSFKYHMGFLEHYRLIIRIMLHPSHKNSRLNENIIQFDWALCLLNANSSHFIFWRVATNLPPLFWEQPTWACDLNHFNTYEFTLWFKVTTSWYDPTMIWFSSRYKSS